MPDVKVDKTLQQVRIIAACALLQRCSDLQSSLNCSVKAAIANYTGDGINGVNIARLGCVESGGRGAISPSHHLTWLDYLTKGSTFMVHNPQVKVSFTANLMQNKIFIAQDSAHLKPCSFYGLTHICSRVQHIGEGLCEGFSLS